MMSYLDRKLHYALKEMSNGFTLKDFKVYINDDKITDEKIKDFLDRLVKVGSLRFGTVRCTNTYFFNRYTE